MIGCPAADKRHDHAGHAGKSDQGIGLVDIHTLFGYQVKRQHSIDAQGTHYRQAE